MYIADSNVFGVDLNPIAVELAEVSLWLNAIFKGSHVPWFGLQLYNGNSWSAPAARCLAPPSSRLAEAKTAYPNATGAPPRPITAADAGTEGHRYLPLPAAR